METMVTQPVRLHLSCPALTPALQMGSSSARARAKEATHGDEALRDGALIGIAGDGHATEAERALAVAAREAGLRAPAGAVDTIARDHALQRLAGGVAGDPDTLLAHFGTEILPHLRDGSAQTDAGSSLLEAIRGCTPSPEVREVANVASALSQRYVQEDIDLSAALVGETLHWIAKRGEALTPATVEHALADIGRAVTAKKNLESDAPLVSLGRDMWKEMGVRSRCGDVKEVASAVQTITDPAQDGGRTFVGHAFSAMRRGLTSQTVDLMRAAAEVMDLSPVKKTHQALNADGEATPLPNVWRMAVYDWLNTELLAAGREEGAHSGTRRTAMAEQCQKVVKSWIDVAIPTRKLKVQAEEQQIAAATNDLARMNRRKWLAYTIFASMAIPGAMCIYGLTLPNSSPLLAPFAFGGMFGTAFVGIGGAIVNQRATNGTNAAIVRRHHAEAALKAARESLAEANAMQQAVDKTLAPTPQIETVGTVRAAENEVGS